MRRLYSHLGAAVGLGLIGGAAFLGSDLTSGLRPAFALAQTASDTQPAPEPLWAAVAPGRVQPKGGEVRLSVASPAVMKQVLVQVSDRVKAGDLLIEFDDEGLRYKLEAAKAELAGHGRDAGDGATPTADRRKADDAVFSAEQSAFDARMEFDRLSIALRNGTAAVGEVEKARSAFIASRDKLQDERTQLDRLLASIKIAPYGKDEAGLIAARAEVLVLQHAIERTKLRAPAASMVLDVTAKQGEVAGGGDNALILLGDTSHLQIRTELEERDIQKVFPGQRVVVKTDTFQGRSFEGRVLAVAKALTAPMLSARNKRGPSDVDVLEVTVDLDNSGPLIPGMRVDVFFKAGDQAAKSSGN